MNSKINIDNYVGCKHEWEYTETRPFLQGFLEKVRYCKKCNFAISSYGYSEEEIMEGWRKEDLKKEEAKKKFTDDEKRELYQLVNCRYTKLNNDLDDRLTLKVKGEATTKTCEEIEYIDSTLKTLLSILNKLDFKG